MTTTPPNESSSNPTDARADDGGQQLFLCAAKGCGCLTALIVLAVGVALAGDGRVESWGSGLIGVLFLVLIYGSSGLTGWWQEKGKGTGTDKP